MNVVLLRVSSEEQRANQSIQLQRLDMQEWVNALKLSNVEWVEDDGVSGVVPLEDRPGGARLLDLLATGQVERVLVWAADRLGRDIGVLVNAIERIEQAGAVLESKREGVLSLKDATKILMTTVQMGMAATERANIAVRVKTRQLQLAAEGTWLTGRIPFGYRKTGMKKDSRLSVNDEEAAIVRRIYKLTAQGLSCRKIADQLNGLGMLDRQDLKWTADRIGNIVASPNNRGEHVYNKMRRVIIDGKKRQRTRPRDEWLSHPCPSIVTPALWEKANEEMKKNRIEAMAHPSYQYLLRGLIHCDCCGLTYASAPVTGTDRFYYRCAGSKRLRGPYGKQGKFCPNKSINGQELEALVVMDIKKFAAQPGDVKRELRKSLARRDEAKPIAAEIAALEKRLASRTQARERVLEQYQDGVISKAQQNVYLMKINSESSSLEQQLAALRAKARDTQANLRQLESVDAVLLKVQKLLEGKPSFQTMRRVVESLIQEIRVVPVPKNSWSKVPGTRNEWQSSYVPGTPIKEGEELEPHVFIRYVFPTPKERQESLPLGKLGTGSTR